MTDSACQTCKGEGWVCEAHQDRPWYDGQTCCGEPGIPCKCNPERAMPPGMRIVWDSERGYLQ
jgi:hypothetical protein